MCPGDPSLPVNYKLWLSQGHFCLSPPAWWEKTRQKNNYSLKLKVWEEFQKLSSRRVQQSKTEGNLKVGERKKERKRTKKKKKGLIIKCCLCKMKNHIVASGHNSPGKPSTISQDRKQRLWREEEQQLHLPDLPAISSERLCLHAWLLMLQANIPGKVFSPYKMHFSPTSTEMNILPILLPPMFGPSFTVSHFCHYTTLKFFQHHLAHPSLHSVPQTSLVLPSKTYILSFRMLL